MTSGGVGAASLSTGPVAGNAGLPGKINIGVAGLGAAGRAFLPAILAPLSGFNLVAVTEPVARIREDALAGHPAAGYDDFRAMLAHPGLDAVYIATPTDCHVDHVMQACSAGKHILVEKPMATQLQPAKDMVAAAEAAGVVMLVGHSHGYDLPIQAMREIIGGGTLGRVQMVNTWCYTDWIYRPRRPDELDDKQGGGVTFRQGSHQFDIVRLLCGGKTRSVRARTFDWDPQRSATGAHVVYLDFEDGAAATAVYNGYGRFSSMDLGFNVSEWGFSQPPENRPALYRSAAASTPEAELAAKQRRAKNAIPASAPLQPFFGLTIVSCERGELRQSPQGITIYSAQGQQEVILPTDRSPRDLVMREFHDAITGKAAPVHTGRWGVANLEICVAAIASSASGRDVQLQEQVGLP
jgi:phthalate 4,5-cis-dihydrodiol dehydrogenase